MSNVKARISNQCQTTKYQKSFELWALDFICHLDFVIWILNRGYTYLALNYEKESSQEHKKIHQNR